MPTAAPPGSSLTADMNCDGLVNIIDLAILVGNWFESLGGCVG